MPLQPRNSQQQDVIWESFLWWAGLAVAVLAVPSIAIIFASVMPFRSDIGESIIFVLLCWTCTYLGMHLMKYYGMELLQQPQGTALHAAMEKDDLNTHELSGYQTISPKPIPQAPQTHSASTHNYIVDRRHASHNTDLKAMLYSKGLDSSTHKPV